MTANQLKYWELRWKQHYEQVYHEEVVRSNKAKEAETRRHNMKEERIATQELVLRRQELGLKWAELEDKIRAEMVKEVIDWENAKTNRYNAMLRQDELKVAAYKAQTERTKVMNELSLEFTKTQLAVADLWLQGVDAKTDKAIKDWEAAIKQADDAFVFKGQVEGKFKPIIAELGVKWNAETNFGKLMLNIMNFGKDHSGRAEFDEVINSIKSIAPKQIEMYGPAAISKTQIDQVRSLDQHRFNSRQNERNFQTTIEGPKAAELNSNYKSISNSVPGVEINSAVNNTNQSTANNNTNLPNGVSSSKIIYSGNAGRQIGPGIVGG